MPDDSFNEYCEALLAQYTRRNTQAVTQRLESLCGFLRQEGNVVQTMLGHLFGHSMNAVKSPITDSTGHSR